MNEIDKLLFSESNIETGNSKLQFSAKLEHSNERKMTLYHPFTHDIVSCDIRTLSSSSSSDEEMHINSSTLSKTITNPKSTTELTENSYDSVFSSMNSIQNNRIRLDSNSNSETSHFDENNSSGERSFEEAVLNSYSEPISTNRTKIGQRFQDAWTSDGYYSLPESYDSSNDHLINFNEKSSEIKIIKPNDAENSVNVISNQSCAAQNHLPDEVINGLDMLSLALPNVNSFNNTQTPQLPQQDLQLSDQESKLFIQYLLNCLANNVQTQKQMQQFQQQKLQQMSARVLNEVESKKFPLNMNHNEANGVNLSGRKLIGNKLVSNATNLEKNPANSSINNGFSDNLLKNVSFPPPPDPPTSNLTHLNPSLCSNNYCVSDLCNKNSNYIQKQSILSDLNMNQKSRSLAPVGLNTKQKTSTFCPNETYQKSGTSNSINMHRRTIRSYQTNLKSNYKAPNGLTQQPNPRLNAKQQRVFKEILLEIEIKKHQQQLMSRYGEKIKYEFKYIVDHDGLLPKGTSAFRMRIPHNSSCSFCANNNLPEEFARSHILKDPNNLILCPILQNYECPICRSTGVRAHTVRYCQMNRQLALERAQLILNMMHVNPNNNQSNKS